MKFGKSCLPRFAANLSADPHGRLASLFYRLRAFSNRAFSNRIERKNVKRRNIAIEDVQLRPLLLADAGTHFLASILTPVLDMQRSSLLVFIISFSTCMIQPTFRKFPCDFVLKIRISMYTFQDKIAGPAPTLSQHGSLRHPM